MKMNQYKVDTNFNPLGLCGLFGDVFDTANQSKYPPYNLYSKDNITIIELAVAGFSIDELTVTLNLGTLTISGEKNESDEKEPVYEWKGIATRKFVTNWKLKKEVEADVSLENGILTVALAPVEKTPGSLEIKTGSFKLPSQPLNEKTI